MNDGNENLKQQKAGNPIFILVIFAALIGFLFYIPEIYKKYNSEIYKFFSGDKEDEKEEDAKKNEKSPISAYYQLGSKSTLTFNELKLEDISLSSNKTLSFTMTTDTDIDLDELEYYVEFYRERKTFLGRRVLHGKVTKEKKFTIDLSNLPVETTTFMTVSHIPQSGIQPLETQGDESGLSSIKCKKENTSYEYQFYQKKLAKTTFKYTYENENLDELAASLLEMQKKEKAYNEFTGVNARITENSTSYIFLSEFDYENVVSFERVGDPRIFDKNTLNSVVKFKMDAEGYDCE